jgi:hypothetical protein
MLREGIIESEAVNSLTAASEIFYRRLMSIVDDYGRFEARPQLLRSRLFGFQLDRWSEKDITAALSECENARMEDGSPLVTVYSVGSKTYLQINNFRQRTRLMMSKYPAPENNGKLRPNDGQATVTCQANDGQATVIGRSDDRQMTARDGDGDGDEIPPKPPAAVPAAGKNLLAPEVEAVLAEVAANIHARHPAIRRCGPSEVRHQLRVIARKEKASGRIDLLREIDQHHAGWCDSPQWQKDGGQYANGLANWLAPTKERWRDPPPEPEYREPEYPKLIASELYP